MTTEERIGFQAEVFAYAQRLGLEKRADPQDDVWTILSTVEVETDDGERTALSQIELDMFFLLLVIAGSETTRNALSQGLVALLDHPEQLEAFRGSPEGIPIAVEEILRWSSPVSCFARRATQDTEIRGVGIAKGDRVTMWYPSANRDDDRSTNPSVSTSPALRTLTSHSAAEVRISALAPTWRAGSSQRFSKCCSNGPNGSS